MPHLNFDLTTRNENKVLSKREPTSAVMTLQVELPGGISLSNGKHTIGFLEGNIAITKVAAVVREGFDGTAPTLTVTNLENGVTETWLTDTPIDVTGSVKESVLTAPGAAGKLAPYNRSKKSEWFATIVGAEDSTKGNVAVLIDYVQLDTEPGEHS